MLTRLERVVDEGPDRPDLAGPDHPMRAVTRQVAESPAGWDPDRAAKIRQLFDGLAPEWTSRFSNERLDAVEDALARGDVPSGGTCLEVGSGTGLITPILQRHFDTVVSLDLSHEMLVRADAGTKVEADGARLPLADRSVEAVVLVNAFLFPHEVDRVLRPSGGVVWVSTIGDRTPIYLPAEDVLDALPGDWDGRAADAGWGCWLAARRSTGSIADT